MLIRCLLRLASHRAKEQRMKDAEDGPPPGTIITGARNWDENSERASERASVGSLGSVGSRETNSEVRYLESIGRREALKPVPPAYGMYRGSIRIADGDISWVRASEVGQTPVIEERRESESQGEAGRPPSYASRAASRQGHTLHI